MAILLNWSALKVVGVHSIVTGEWVRDLPCGQAVSSSFSLPTVTGLLVAGDMEVLAAAVQGDRSLPPDNIRITKVQLDS